MMLLGDYGVLDGGSAIVAAVNRRAVGQIEACEPSEVVRAVLARAGSDVQVKIDTQAFYDGEIKLGVGSSAAVAVVTAALAMQRGDDSALAVAIDGHRDANDGKGSGVDVAASFHGGVIVTKRQPAEVKQLAPRIRRLFLSVLFTGKSASTKELVSRATACVEWPQYSKILRGLTDDGIEAWNGQDPARFLSVVGQYHRAMAELGHAAEIPIVTEEIAAIAAYAVESGGAAKPSGAGGGDIVVVWSADPDAGSRIAEKTGARRLDIDIDERGLERS